MNLQAMVEWNLEIYRVEEANSMEFQPKPTLQTLIGSHDDLLSELPLSGELLDHHLKS